MFILFIYFLLTDINIALLVLHRHHGQSFHVKYWQESEA